MTANTTSLTTPLQVPQAPPLRPARDSFWTRIAAELAEAIGSGVYPPGQRLPSEHALAEHFGVNRHTIRRSLASLCSQGLVRITQGSGTYVEDFAVDLVLGKRTRHQQGLAQAGLRGSLVVLQAQTTRATAALAKALQVPARSPLLALRVRGDAEGQPLHISERYFPLPRFENLATVVRETGLHHRRLHRPRRGRLHTPRKPHHRRAAQRRSGRPAAPAHLAPCAAGGKPERGPGRHSPSNGRAPGLRATA